MKKCCEIVVKVVNLSSQESCSADRWQGTNRVWMCICVCACVCARVYVYVCPYQATHHHYIHFLKQGARCLNHIFNPMCPDKTCPGFPILWQPQTVEMLSNSSFILLLLGMVDIILGNVDGFMRMILDHPVIILCMVYDHPELGMIGYHPGMWMVYLNLQFVWNFYWGWLWPSWFRDDRLPSWDVDGLSQPSFCVKFLLRMVVTIL